MHHRARILALFALMALAPHRHAAAGVVQFTTTNAIVTAGNTVVTIDPTVASADRLLSISDGTATGYEFSSFNLLARFDFGPDQVIYTVPSLIPSSSQHVTINLTSVPSSDFSSAGNLVGLVFNINEGVNIPAGTVFTFNSTIPEPAVGALLGLAALGSLGSRRRQRVSARSSRS